MIFVPGFSLSDIIKFIFYLKQRGSYNYITNNNWLHNYIIGNLDKVLQELLNTITHVPTISNIDGIVILYNMIRIVCLSCVGLLICYKGFKMLYTYDYIEKAEGRQLLGRLSYSFVLGFFCLKIIDMLIIFNNLLIRLFITKFSLTPSIKPLDASYGILLAVVTLSIGLIACIKILIGFWMRIAELVFMGVIGPIVFTLWINSEWAAYLKIWWKRIVILVFTQFCQVLLFIIYTMLLKDLVVEGSINNICLFIAVLISVDYTPVFLNNFMDNKNSGYIMAKRTFIHTAKTGKDIIKFIKK